MKIQHLNSPNKGSRFGWKPDVIVFHITDGSYEGAVSWLCNKQSGVSSHFVVGRSGQVSQLVEIQSEAHCNGTQSDNPLGYEYVGKATSALVKQRKVNANFYTISIECEGNNQTHGILSNVQESTIVELIKYIKQQVKIYYGTNVPIDRQHIIGHCEIAPMEKPDCPGKDFPFDRIIGKVIKIVK